jgi:hypothetical protein
MISVHPMFVSPSRSTAAGTRAQHTRNDAVLFDDHSTERDRLMGSRRDARRK